jgi:hypothetical protein
MSPAGGGEWPSAREDVTAAKPSAVLGVPSRKASPTPNMSPGPPSAYRVLLLPLPTHRCRGSGK